MFKNEISKVTKCEILFIHIADHTPVIMELKLKNEQGESIWRLNNSSLGDHCFKEKIICSMKSYLEINDNGVAPEILWEAAKATIRGERIAYSSLKKRQREKEKTALENKIKKLQEEHEKL